MPKVHSLQGRGSGGEGKVGEGGGEVVYYINFFYSICFITYVASNMSHSRVQHSCRFPSVRAVCLDVAARRLAVLLLPP